MHEPEAAVGLGDDEAAREALARPRLGLVGPVLIAAQEAHPIPVGELHVRKGDAVEGRGKVAGLGDGEGRRKRGVEPVPRGTRGRGRGDDHGLAVFVELRMKDEFFGHVSAPALFFRLQA